MAKLVTIPGRIPKLVRLGDTIPAPVGRKLRAKPGPFWHAALRR